VLKLYLLALVVSLLLSLAFTPLSALVARRFGAMDAPDPRKVHQHPTPRWGGLGVMAGFFAAVYALWKHVPAFRKLLAYNHGIVKAGRVVFTLNLGEQLAGILFGTALLFGVGLVDDRKSVPAGTKFTLQIVAAYVAMTYGVRIYGVSVHGFESIFPLWLMQVVTVLWLAGVSNAVNLIDGLDGLAAGVTAIAAGAFLAVTLIQEKSSAIVFSQQMKLAGVIASALMGGLLGFLVYNSHPAKVFMGDSGSLSIGFLIGCVAVIGAFKTTTLVVLLVPFILVAIPVADMTLAFGRRLLKGRSPFEPDRGHLHHRLLDAGWTQREVVFLVYVVSLLLASLAITAVAMKRSA
jgi:UDP-GlcNAc:undecaprenyl-phosphate GlcNAc-1-phosphate transferase